MQAVENLKFLGAFSIFVFWISLALLLKKIPRDKTKTISRHVAKDKHAYIFLAIVETFVMPQFFVFTLYWFVPTFHLSWIFTVLVGLAGLGYMVAAWIPHTEGNKALVHAVAAYGAALTFIPASIILALSSEIAVPARVSGAISCFLMLAAIVTSLVTESRAYMLVSQTTYIACFHFTILLATYLPHN